MSLSLMITLITRLVIASIVGIIIGIERTKRGKNAGVATFSIICLASCFLTIVSAYGLGTQSDPSRLVANIITAIGFVAGGVIFTIDKDNKRKVSGLTTGAILFCVASLGIGIGLGMHILVFTVVLLIEFNINIGIYLKKHFNKKEKEEKLQKEIHAKTHGIEHIHEEEEDNLDI